MKTEIDEEKKWINMVKAVAIAGVLVQHTSDLLYSDQRIYQSATYAVAVFIMMGGYLAARSYERKGVFSLRNKLIRLLIPYIIATIVYILYKGRRIDIENALYHIIHFDVSEPFYYVWVYCQLLIMSPFLLGVLKWADCGGVKRYIRKLAVLIFVLFVCYFNVNYTTALGLWYSGGHWGGGSWLFYWYLGMELKLQLDYEYRHPQIIFWWSLGLWMVWEYMFVMKDYLIYFPSMFHDEQLVRGWMHVPQTVLVVLIIKAGTACMEKCENKIWKAVSKAFSSIGKNTLYLFLYHMLFRDIGIEICGNRSIWETRICIGGLMLLGPLCLAYLGHVIWKWYCSNISIVRRL